MSVFLSIFWCIPVHDEERTVWQIDAMSSATYLIHDGVDLDTYIYGDYGFLGGRCYT